MITTTTIVDCSKLVCSILCQNSPKLTHLDVSIYAQSVSEPDQLAHLCSRFTALTYLSINLGTLTVAQLAQPLATLPQLHTLTLGIDFVYARNNSSILFCKEDEDLAETLTPLTSIRNLELRLALRSHRQISGSDRHAWSRLFPLVECILVHLYHSACNRCDAIDAQ